MLGKELSPGERLTMLQKVWSQHESIAKDLLQTEIPEPYRSINISNWIETKSQEEIQEWQRARELAFAFNESFLHDENGNLIPGRRFFGEILSALRYVSKSLEENSYDQSAKILKFTSPDGLPPNHPVRLYCDRRAIWKTEIWIEDSKPALFDLLGRLGLYSLPDKRNIEEIPF